jgi:3-carboxy-cis,cis-muconate cycloisomerase
MVQQLTSLVRRDDLAAAEFVHWGATSQDAVDTGMVLQLRAALIIISRELYYLAATLAKLSDLHRSTLIAGRTWMQHASPTTFGVKVAGWLDAVHRHLERLDETRERALVLQFGGAVGTLSAFGERATKVSEALGRELALSEPAIPWHSHRDRFAEVATTLGLLTGTLGKMARDIALHAQTEINELREPTAAGRGSSTAMPQKQNPVASAVALAGAVRVPGLVATLLAAMPQEYERGLGGWQAEWEVLPEIVCLTGGVLHHLNGAISAWQIDTPRMRENLEITHGLIYAEAASAAAAARLGRWEARRLVEVACQRALADCSHLREILLDTPEFLRHFKREEISDWFDARKFSAAGHGMIDKVLAADKSLPARPKPGIG